MEMNGGVMVIEPTAEEHDRLNRIILQSNEDARSWRQAFPLGGDQEVWAEMYMLRGVRPLASNRNCVQLARPARPGSRQRAANTCRAAAGL